MRFFIFLIFCAILIPFLVIINIINTETTTLSILTITTANTVMPTTISTTSMLTTTNSAPITTETLTTTTFIPTTAPPLESTTLWARSVLVQPTTLTSRFYSTATDLDGNIYMVGDIDSRGDYDFGNNVTISNSSITAQICFLVKYDSNGIAQWVKSIRSNSSASCSFQSIRISSDNKIYISGSIGSFAGIRTYDFGNGVTITTSFNIGLIPLLVKYDLSGVAEWATIPLQINAITSFVELGIGLDGNIYVFGSAASASFINFGNNVTLTNSAFAFNPILVKYNSSGVAQWAITCPGTFTFYGISVYADIYLSGTAQGLITSNFGNGVNFTNSVSSSACFIVKYNLFGIAQWVKTPGICFSNRVVSTALDGSIYFAGNSMTQSFYNFGNGINITNNTNFAFLVKYDALGVTQWVQFINTVASYQAVKTAIDGSIYVVGGIFNQNNYTFGNNVTIISSSTASSGKCLIVKYNSSGFAQWAKTNLNTTQSLSYYDLSIDLNSNVYAHARDTLSATYNFGDGVILNTVGNQNGILVKYR